MRISYSRSYFGTVEAVAEDRVPERLRTVAGQWAESMRPGSSVTLYASELCSGFGCGRVEREAYANPTWIAEVSDPSGEVRK